MATPEHDEETGESPDSGEGMASLASGTLAALLDHLEARLELARLEAEEARSAFFRQILLLIAGAGGLAIAYLAALAGTVGWLARAASLEWPHVALGAALLHLLCGLALLRSARRFRPATYFADSIDVLRRDRERLRRRDEPTGHE